MTTFTFHGEAGAWDNVWRAVERVTDRTALLEAALARLRAETPQVESDGVRIVVHEEGVRDVDARAAELVRVLSAEPYLIAGTHVFLPLCHGAPYSSALRWTGDLATSRFHQFTGPTRLGEHVVLRRQNQSIVLEPISKPRDAVTLLGGAPLERPQNLPASQLLYLTRRSDPAWHEAYIVFTGHPEVVYFGKSLLLPAMLGMTQDPWTRTALEAAKLRGSSFSLMLIDRAASERRDRVAELPSNVRRTVGYLHDVISIAAEGAPEDLLVHGDQMREHFSSPDLRIADAIAAPGESPSALYERVRAMLGR